MAQRLYLGIDGGGSNITTVVIDDTGQILYEQTTGGGANYHALGLESVIAHLQGTVQLATQQLSLSPPIVFDKAVFGLAGCNFESDQRLLVEQLRRSSLSSQLGGGFEVVNDSHIALRSGTEDNTGLVLIAGTGSNCYGRRQDGRQARAGGVDYILSDEGSAYDIGLRLLKAVTRTIDGRGPATRLVDDVFQTMSVASLAELYEVVYRDYTTKPQVAALAQLVGQAAEAQDQVAQDLLNHAVNELLKMVGSVIEQLELADKSVPIVQIGSVFQDHQYLDQRMAVELKRVAPRARLVKPSMTSAHGAALMAQESDLRPLSAG